MPAKLPAAKDLIAFVRSILRHWGAVVTGGAIIGGLGIYAAVRNLPHWSYFVIGGLGMVVASYGAWLDEHKKAEAASALSANLQAKLDAIPLKVEMRVEDFFLRPSFESHALLNFDLFLYVCVKLVTPQSQSIRFSLQLIAPTSTLNGYGVADMDSWVKTKKVPPDPFGYEQAEPLYVLMPLADKFESGHPLNGWLHFTTLGLPDSELLSCRLRLLAKSDHGTDYCDIEMKSWPIHRKDFKIVPKKAEEDYAQRSPENPQPPTV